MAITRGTTPTHIFNTDIDLTQAEAIYITYEQYGRTVIEKSGDISVTPTQAEVSLTQKETLRLKDAPVQIQIRAKFADGSALASNIINTTVEEVLKGGEI